MSDRNAAKSQIPYGGAVSARIDGPTGEMNGLLGTGRGMVKGLGRSPVPSAPKTNGNGRAHREPDMLPTTRPPPRLEGADELGSLAHLAKERASQLAAEHERALAEFLSDGPPSSMVPLTTQESSEVRVKNPDRACVIEEVLTPARRDYRRE